MSEILRGNYKPLFETRLLHHYWLDEGTTPFDLMADANKKNQRLLDYDRRDFLSVTPTADTARRLRGLNCIYKDTALGFIVATPALTQIPADTLFEFAITVTDSAFFNYTALTLETQNIVELYYPPEKKLYRYKTKVYAFSNLTGASRGAGNNKTLFLSAPYSTRDTEDKVESLVLNGNALSQLTSDPPNPALQPLNAQAGNLPVFAHQDDWPIIVPPAGLNGAPKRGILLSDDLPDTLFALIRLTPIRNDDGDFSFTNINGRAKTPHPVFHIRFKNRSTTRQYLNQRTGALVFTEPEALPLTHFGNAGSRRKPAKGWVKAEKSGAKITRLISEIFV